MERQGMSKEAIDNTVPKIWEGTSDGDLKVVREYTVEYRKQVEGDIADASVDYINRMSKEDEPFFLYVGWSHAHYPNYVPEEFEGKASHPYGDAIMELDYRTGEVLDAIEKAGIEDNTIVIWISDNANGNTEYILQVGEDALEKEGADDGRRTFSTQRNTNKQLGPKVKGDGVATSKYALHLGEGRSQIIVTNKWDRLPDCHD